ncbi:MAG: hypothetical protein WBL11_03710, partial [Bacteroidales bacterium]
MYKKIPIFVFITILFSINIFSQKNKTYSSGGTYPFSKDMMQIIHFNSLSDNNILFFSKVGDNYKVELIDTKKLSINKSLDIPHKIKVGGYSYQIDYINSFIINDNLYVFYKLYDRNKKGNALWYNV